MREIIIVGASAAGLRCACRLARLEPDFKVTVLEARRTFSYAACGLPYVLSGDVPDPQALRRTVYGATRDAAYFEAYKGVEVLEEIFWILPLSLQTLQLLLIVGHQ